MDEQRQGDQLEPIYNSSDTVYSLEDPLGAMDDRDEWRERVWEIRADSAIW